MPFTVTLRERLNERPAIDRLVGAIDLRGHSGTGNAAWYRKLYSMGVDRAVCPVEEGVRLAAELQRKGYLLAGQVDEEDVQFLEDRRATAGETKVQACGLANDVLSALYGLMPAAPRGDTDWRGLLRRFYRVAPVFRATGYDRMEGPEPLTEGGSVLRTRFSGGTVVTANFGPRPYELDSGQSPTDRTLVLPELGYVVNGPALAAYRALVGGDVVEYLESGDRACLSSPGRFHDGGALAAQGTVIVGYAGEKALVLAWDTDGPAAIREEGPLAGRSLARARLVGIGADGEEVTGRSSPGPRELIFEPAPGVERYEIHYGRGSPKRSDADT